jgi:hypothetical protein
LSEREVDQLRYKGNGVPRVLRFAWTVFILFSIAYLAYYAWPDLRSWLELTT